MKDIQVVIDGVEYVLSGEQSFDPKFLTCEAELGRALGTKGMVSWNGMILMVQTQREALERLSCLGNGDRPGNSMGNEIATAALRHLEP